MNIMYMYKTKGTKILFFNFLIMENAKVLDNQNSLAFLLDFDTVKKIIYFFSLDINKFKEVKRKNWIVKRVFVYDWVIIWTSLDNRNDIINALKHYKFI